MEHDTSLWTAPYHDEKYGKELGASWKYFQEFIKLPTPRTLVHFHEVLANNLANSGRKRIPSYEKIREYSAKWKWLHRAEAYDNWKRDVDDEALKEEIRQIREDRIRASRKRMQYQDQLFDDLMQDNEMATNQKVYGASKNSEAIRNETASFNEIVNEGQTNINMDLDADVTADVQSENKTTATIYDMVDSQLELDDVTGEEGHSDNEEG